MQKSLKKSLYLGLAALSFASVAGATNANAAKKHHSKKTVKTVKKAKPVTYTSSYNLDQSVVYSLNGNNAIYTKPGTVKGARVVASKSDVKSVANSSKGYFMAYGEAKTSKGAHYYKVVSFDHKYRGWVYAGSAKKVDATTTSTDVPSNNLVYLKSNVSNTLWDAPKYSAFKTTKLANNNSAIANDQYKVDKAVKLNREGWTYYHVTNQANPSYSGWVWAGATNDAKPTDNFNSVKDIKVNFTTNGSVVKSVVFHAYDAGIRTINNGPIDSKSLANNLFSAANGVNGKSFLANALDKSNYTLNDVDANKLTSDNGVFNDKSSNANALKNVKFGDTVWLNVTKNNQVQSKFNAYTMDGNKLDNSVVRFPSLDAKSRAAFKSSDSSVYQTDALDKDATSVANKLSDVVFGLPDDSATDFTNGNYNYADNHSKLGFLLGNKNLTFNDINNINYVYKNDQAALRAYDKANVANKTNSFANLDTFRASSQYDNFKNENNTDKDMFFSENGSVVSDPSTSKESVKFILLGKTSASTLSTYTKDYKNATTVQFGSSDSFNGVTMKNENARVLAGVTVPTSMNDYLTPLNGGNGAQYHYVYVVAKDNTTNGMTNKRMGDGINQYYYRVPVAGPAATYSSDNSTDY
ncbi:hypothetical protein [Apilactobacillus ozensis]|uniref:hypothetical protein n=1 Tax=Apilactobacillus ozensis TaxID=866801 RepID=UPI00200A6BDD|nr:hypothetical protein [Apilactobacillus ozensis]MCK8607391.1 hypothetical protein [Apilactobacillus ozensis]